MDGSDVKFIDSALELMYKGGWELCALVVGPLAAIRVIQSIRRVWRKLTKEDPVKFPEPHWLTLQSLTFLLAFTFSFIPLQFKYTDLPALTFVCFLLALFNSAIVEFILKKAKKSEALSSALNTQTIYVPEDEEHTVMTRFKAVATGSDVKVDKRSRSRPVSEEDITEKRK